MESLKKYNQFGFSLIELLIAVFLIGILSLALSQSLISIIRSNLKAEIQKDIKENGDYAMEYIGRILRNGKSISFGATMCTNGNSASGTTMNVTDSEGVISRVLCNNDPNNGYIYENSIPIISNISKLGLINCLFSCTSQANTPSTVKVEFTLQQQGNPSDVYIKASQSFESTFNLRNK